MKEENIMSGLFKDGVGMYNHTFTLLLIGAVVYFALMLIVKKIKKMREESKNRPIDEEGSLSKKQRTHNSLIIREAESLSKDEKRKREREEWRKNRDKNRL